jgi:hypothetical protein
MNEVTKGALMAHRGPEPISERISLSGLPGTLYICGVVKSSARSAIYAEIDNMADLKSIRVDGELVEIAEDNIIAACWAEACVTSPKLTSMEWLIVGAHDGDLLSAVGLRCLVCSRVIPGESSADGVRAAEEEFENAADPFVSSRFSLPLTSSDGSQPSSKNRNAELENAGTNLTIV